MKKFVLPIIIVIAISGSLLYLKLRPHTQATTLQPRTTGTPSSTPLASPAAGTPPVTYKDGEYTGAVAASRYGAVQVRATVVGGKLTDITLLQMPDEPGHTAELSNSSGPQLRQEALTAQSANVDIVAGATQTSEGFQQSLSDALSQAKA